MSNSHEVKDGERRARVYNEEASKQLETELNNFSTNWDSVVDLISNWGAHPDVRNKYGFTALHHACTMHKPEIVMSAINAGANVNVEKDGITPLCADAHHRETTITQLLLEAGADPNYRTANPPLRMAAISGFTEKCDLLTSYGAIDFVDPKTEKTPSLLALHHGWVNCANAIKGGAAVYNARLAFYLNSIPARHNVLGTDEAGSMVYELVTGNPPPLLHEVTSTEAVQRSTGQGKSVMYLD